MGELVCRKWRSSAQWEELGKPLFHPLHFWSAHSKNYSRHRYKQECGIWCIASFSSLWSLPWLGQTWSCFDLLFPRNPAALPNLLKKQPRETEKEEFTFIRETFKNKTSKVNSSHNNIWMNTQTKETFSCFPASKEDLPTLIWTWKGPDDTFSKSIQWKTLLGLYHFGWRLLSASITLRMSTQK